MSNPHAPVAWQDPENLFTAALEDPWYKAIFKIMAHFTDASHGFFSKKGLAPALMPITCTAVSSPMGLGSDSLPVAVELFDRKTYLADSMQFQLEYLMRQHPAGTWYIMPTFRGEDPDNRHLNQFFHSEAEIPGKLEDVMAFVGEYVNHVTDKIFDALEHDIESLTGDTSHIRHLLSQEGKFQQISHAKASDLLGDDSAFYDIRPGGIRTISRKGEQALMARANGPVWLTHLPAKSVPFYQATIPETGEALCADLLFGIGETVGCGQRNTTYQETLLALESHQVNPADYAWYLRMKDLYPMQTAGFGLGLERYILWLLKHDDIRDIPLMTRDRKSVV